MLACAAVAKLIAGVSTYPYQVVKARMQVRADEYQRFDRASAVVTHIVRNEGFRGFYRGMGPSVARVVPGAAVVFATYEQVRTLLRTAGWE